MKAFLLSALMLASVLFASPRASAVPTLTFVDGSAGKVVVVDYKAAQAASRPRTIQLAFSPGEAERIRKFLSDSAGGVVTLEVGGKALALPLVRDVPRGTELELTFDDETEFAAAANALTAGAADVNGDGRVGERRDALLPR